MVRELENVIWAMSFPLNPTPPNPAVNEGATYHSGAQALSQTFEPPPDARDPVSQPVHIGTRELLIPSEGTRARGNVARRTVHPDAPPTATGEPCEFTVTLMWGPDKSYRTRVLVGDLIRGQLASNLKWPDPLLIEPAWQAMHHDKFQQWLKEHKPVKVRLQAASGTEKHEFDQLLEWLRRNEWYAAADWAVQGDDPSTTDLLLTSCGTSLVGALFPVSGMPESAKSQLQRLDPTAVPTMSSMASCSHQLQTLRPNWNAVAVQEQQLPAQQNQQPTWPRAETTAYGDTGMNTGQSDGNGPFISGHVTGESSGPSWWSDTF